MSPRALVHHVTCEVQNGQYGIVPPSTGNMHPVMLRAASEASITATAATCSTVLHFLIADSLVNRSSIA